MCYTYLTGSNIGELKFVPVDHPPETAVKQIHSTTEGTLEQQGVSVIGKMREEKAPLHIQHVHVHIQQVHISECVCVCVCVCVLRACMCVTN